LSAEESLEKCREKIHGPEPFEIFQQDLLVIAFADSKQQNINGSSVEGGKKQKEIHIISRR